MKNSLLRLPFRRISETRAEEESRAPFFCRNIIVELVDPPIVAVRRKVVRKVTFVLRLVVVSVVFFFDGGDDDDDDEQTKDAGHHLYRR